MTRALVTGAAGFIGSHLVRELLQRDYDVLAVDNLSTGARSNLPPDGTPNFRFVQGDIRDADGCRTWCREIDVVFHEAAKVSVPESIETPDETFAVNAGGTFHLLEAARLQGVRRFVYASSCAVYGDDPVLPKSEHMALSPRSPYAASKAASEQFALSYHGAWGIETIGLRYFNVFGPGQDPNGAYAAVVAAFVNRCLQGKGCTIYGTGEQTRDFVFVKDVVRANILAGEAPAAAAGQVYNIGSGSRTSVRGLYDAIAQAAGVHRVPRLAPPRSGDVMHSLANIGQAYSNLGYLPQTSFQEGIDATVAWYRASAAADVPAVRVAK